MPVVKAAADSASDYSTWSVQQLMQLYYGMGRVVMSAQSDMHADVHARMHVHTDCCMRMVQVACFHIKICSNGWCMAMVSACS